MIGVSGCFGARGTDWPIDDIGEAAAAVDEILDSAMVQPTDPPESEPEGPAPDLATAQLVGQYLRRLRLLTWAVVAIVVYLALMDILHQTH